MPPGVTWSVTVNGTGESLTTNGGTDALTWTGLANGTYSYSIAGIPGETQTTLPSGGTVTVKGSSVTEPTLSYTQTTPFHPYKVTFTETGLPSGTNWSVTLSGSPRYSTNSTLSGQLPNGTYDFFFGTSAAYTPSPRSMNVTIAGSPVSRSVTFNSNKSTSASGFLGLPGRLGYYLVGAVAVVVVAGGVTGAVVRSRRRRRHRPGPSVGTPPSGGNSTQPPSVPPPPPAAAPPPPHAAPPSPPVSPPAPPTS